MKPARTGLLALGAVLACGVCFLIALVIGSERGEGLAPPDQAQSAEPDSGDGGLSAHSFLGARPAPTDPQAETGSIREAQDSAPVPSQEAKELKGFTLRVRAMWGAVAPIAHQGFQVTVRAFLDPTEEVEQPESQAEGWSHLGRLGAPTGERKPLPGGIAVGTSDENGNVIFRNLPAGMLTIQALGNGLSRSSTERRFAFTKDAAYVFVVAAGLAYGGCFDAPVEEGLQIRLHRDGGEPSRLVLGADGCFVFRGLTRGNYQVDLYDPSRWAVLESYPSFELQEDRFDVRLALPRWGELSVRVWDLPEGVRLSNGYLKRSLDSTADRSKPSWIPCDDASEEQFRFKDLAYGNYVLYLRGEREEEVEGESSLPAMGRMNIRLGRPDGESSLLTLGRLNIRLDRPDLDLDWNYVPTPKVWVQVSRANSAGELLAPDLALDGSSPNEVLENQGITITQGQIDLIRQGRGNEISLGGLAGSKPPLIEIVPGRFLISAVDDGIEQEQGFNFVSGKIQPPLQEKYRKLSQPFLERSPMVQGGSMELMLPAALGDLRLRVELAGYHAETLTFAPSEGLVLKVLMRALEPVEPAAEADGEGQ